MTRWSAMVVAGVFGLAIAAELTAAPSLSPQIDTVDHLTADAPLDGWVMLAQSRTIDLERQRPSLNPQLVTRNTNAEDAGISDKWRCSNSMCIRSVSRQRGSLAIVGDPCNKMATEIAPTPRLPSRFRFSKFASLGIAPEIQAGSAQ